MALQIDRRGFLKLVASVAGEAASPSRGSFIGSTSDPRPGPCTLEVLSEQPARPHNVSPGSTTTFVLAVTNTAPTPVAALLSVRPQSEGWSAQISEADGLFQPLGPGAEATPLTLEGVERRLFVVRLGPDSDRPDGSLGQIGVHLSVSGRVTQRLVLRGKVRTAPKVYIMAYDGLAHDYVRLDSSGEYGGVETDPLMPHFRSFLSDSAYLALGRCQLPSSTDSNHVAALTGSWPGTTGVISVYAYYYGLDPEGNPITGPGGSHIMRWGSNGDPIRSLFHIAKDPAMGGDPSVFNAMVLGKGWVGDYFIDGQGAVDIIATGYRFPLYQPVPEPYQLGDPPSDGDAATDRDGWNLTPLSAYRMIPKPPFGTKGDHPDINPEDRWVVEGALRIIAVEDPDILYVLPGNTDPAQHHVGTADRPDEWDHGVYPQYLWDDHNKFNPHAHRDPVLDVLREADLCFGLIVYLLKQRGIYDSSVVALISDHGQATYMEQGLDTSQIIHDAGVPDEAVEYMIAMGETAYIWLADPAYAGDIESALEDYAIYHPIFHEVVHPFVVLTRPEMDTGVDGVLGRLAGDGGPHRGELYSEWYIEYAPQDGSAPKWPDLIVWTTHRYLMTQTYGWTNVVGSHGGLGWEQRIPLAIRGPGISKGHFDEQEAYLVDLAPTLYHLLGLDLPAHVDGRVLSEILPGS